MWAYRSLGIGRWPHDFTDYAQFCITTNKCRRTLVVDLLKELDVRCRVIDPAGLLAESAGA